MRTFKKTTIAAMVCGAIASGAYAQTNTVVDGKTFADLDITAATNNPMVGALGKMLGAADSLTVTGSKFTNNMVTITHDTSGNPGGAAVSVRGAVDGDNYSKVVIENSDFVGNKFLVPNGAVNGAYGGAIGLNTTATTLSNVTLAATSCRATGSCRVAPCIRSKEPSPPMA